MDCNQLFEKVMLSGGRLELVPAGTVLLNPALEGRRARIWGVWAFDPDAPCDLVGAANGKCLGPLMAYLSDRDDVWKFGQEVPARFASAVDAGDCMAQALELQTLALGQIEQLVVDVRRPFAFGWAMFDMASNAKTARMGTGPVLSKRYGGE